MGKTMQVLLRLAIAAGVFGAGPAAAQQQAEPPAPNVQPGQRTITIAALVVLIKGTVMALHQANVTGNYTVLRDLGTPMFCEKFDQAALAVAFADLRERKLDLSPAALVDPILSRGPQFRNSELILTGNFPAEPLQIIFDLRFVQVDSIWRLAAIGVDAVPAPEVMAVAMKPAELPGKVKTVRKRAAKPRL